jgi:peptidyl-prolyl cis-trans isomerase SurA
MTMVRAFGALIFAALLTLGAALPVAAAVKVTVNDTPITDVQIAQRLKLYPLEGKSASSKAATAELVNEALMLGEAKRLGINVSDTEVSNAFTNVARNIKVSPAKLVEILQQSGVNPETLKDRLRASIAWGQVTQAAIAPRVQVSDIELEQKAVGKLSAANSFDYILKEIIFIGGAGRTGQANKYRQGFKGCDSAVQESLAYTDAAVIDVGRRHATQLPEPVANELSKLNVGGITKPRVVQTGVSMLAICQKAEARDTTFIKGAIRNEASSEQLKGEVDKYLEEVRGRSKIVYN